MLAKCANPACSTRFRYFGKGRLFPFEIKDPCEPCKDVPNAVCARKPHHHTIFFWLCQSCAASTAVRFDQHNGVSVLPAEVSPSGARDQYH